MRPSFFGVQLACRVATDDPLRRDLTDLVRAHRQARDDVGQRKAWQSAGRMLNRPRPLRGTWDLLRDGAEAAWDEWVGGLEAMATWSTADFGGGDLLLLSLVLLVERDSSADDLLGEVCDLPEADWHRARTYGRLLELPGRLPPTGIHRCGLYVSPRPDRGGFSQAVLESPDFSYLAAVI